MTTRTILLVAWKGSSEMERFLRSEGHRVLAAADGASALEVTVSKKPDLILLDEDCGILDAKTFSMIVKSNPNTSSTPVLLSSEGVFAKPFDGEEVLAAIENALARRGAGERKAKDEMTVGTLGPLSVVDLLQALRMHRRSGKLLLRFPGGEGGIWIEDGELNDARLGPFRGKKALFRLLSLEEGSFELLPASTRASKKIDGSFDHLVLESARQQDELKRALRRLPAPPKRLTSQVDPEAVPSANPLFTSILRKLWGVSQSVRELLELEALDLEVVLALEELLRIGWVGMAPRAKGDTAPLIKAESLRLLRQRLPPPAFPGQTAGKILLLADAHEPIRRLLHGLSERWEVRPAREPLAAGWGTVGTVDLGGGASIDLVALPSEEELAPIAIFLARGALGALVVGSADIWGWLPSWRALPVVAAEPTDPLAALRQLLLRLVAP